MTLWTGRPPTDRSWVLRSIGAGLGGTPSQLEGDAESADVRLDFGETTPDW